MVRSPVRSLAALAAGAAILLSSAEAQTAGQLAEIERARRAAQDEARQLTAEAAAARNEAATLERRLRDATQRRSEAEAAAREAEDRYQALGAQAAAEQVQARRSRRALEGFISAQFFVARRNSPLDARARLVARAAGPAMLARAAQDDAAVRRTRMALAATNEEAQVLADAQAAIAAEQDGIAALREGQRQAQTALAGRAAQAERRAVQLAAEARDLRQLIERAERARTRTASASTGGAVSGASAPTSWLAPTQGRVIRAFGEREASSQPARGASVHTAHGAPVTAPADGEIAYADVFRSYGRVLILNLDDGYAVVLAGLESAQVQAGQRVRAGQVIGAMPNSDNPAPELYVEVRRQGRPINPGPWLRARGVNAQSPNSQGLSAERVARNAG